MNKLLVFCLAAISIAIFTMNSHAQRVQWYASDNATNNYHLLSEQPFGKIEDLRFGDFDGNGITDVFTVDPAGQWMLSYNGTSPFQVINVDSTRSVNDLRFGDFDGDGKADVFAVTASGQWMISSGGGTPYQTLASDPNFKLDDLRFGDFNNNEKTDVFVVDTQGVYGEPGRWRYSDGAVSSWETLAGDASRTIDQYLFADIVGDRRTDVFTIAPDGTWLASDGGAGGYQQLASDASRTINDLRIGDFDFDLYADVFTTDAAGQWYISYRGTNGYLAVAQDGDRTIDDLRFGDAVNDTRYGDFNGDGATDVFMVKELPLNKPLRNGSAIKFNGTDQHVFVSEIDAPFQYEFSAEAWIKFSPTISTPSYTILSKGDSGTGTIFSVWSDDKLAFYPGGNGSDGVAWVFSDVAIPRDEWVHVAVAHGGTAVTFYINGQPAGSPSVSPNRVIHQSKSISIGNQNGVLPYSTYVNLFQGEIADVRLWNSVLTQEKILKSIDQPLPLNQPGFAGYWPMNDASGFTVLSAYAGANGLLVNENSSWTSARIPLFQGQAMSFDGVDDFVKIPSYPPSFSEMTIEAWVYLQDLNPGTFKTIFTKGTAGNGTIFSISNENKLAFYPGSSSWVYSNAVIPENQWTHIAVVRKGDQTTFYVNGAEDSTHTHPGVLDPTSNASIGNQDGDGSDNLTNLFTGRMDELRVWYDARTSNEITGNMLNTVLYNEPGLVTYYKMDNLYGTTVIDQTMNNVNGVVQNSLGRVPSDIFNSANLPDPITGKISNGVVSIGELLNGSADATYNNINITDIPDVGSVYIPGEVVVDVNNASITGGGGSVSIFALPFTVHGLALRNGKLGLDVSLTPPNEFFTWDDSNRSYLLMDSSGVELDGGRIDVQNAWFLKFTVKDGYVELRTSEKEFGAGAKVSIPGAGLKGLISPKVWDGYFKTVDGLPSAFSIKGTNLGVPLGVPQVVLHTVGLEGSNLTDLSQMIFTGQMKITAGPNVGTLSSPVFPVALDTVGTVKSNGYIDINSDLTMFKIFHAGGANITYRPPTNFAVNNAYINFLDVYKSTTDLSVIDGAFSGSMKGELQIPTSVPIFGGLNLASAQAVIHDYKHFSGSISVTGIPIGVENVEHCVDLKGTECVLGVCVTIDLGRHCITVPEPVLSSTLKLNFDYNNGVFTYPANAPDPTLAWEVPYNKTYHTQSGTFSFMTNWNRVDKALKAPASVKQIASLASAPSPGEVSGKYRPFQTESGGDPVTVFTLDEGDFDAIFRITYENADVTDISATLTKPDGETIDIHDGAFPDSFQDGIGFTRIIPETREAYFYLFEHEAGEYTVTLNHTDNLGAYSAELLVETPAPFVDLVSVFPWEDNDFDLLWFGVDPEDGNEIRVFLDSDREGLNGYELTDIEHYVEDEETMIACHAEDIPPGWYYPYMTVSDGVNPLVYDYSNVPIFISNPDYPESVRTINVKPINGGFVVDWEPIDDESIINYTVLYTTQDDTGQFEHYQIVNADETSTVIHGLDNGTPVLVSVVAGREDGFQSAAEVIERVAPTLGPGQTPPAIRSTPGSLVTAGLTYTYIPQIFDADLETTFYQNAQQPDVHISYEWQLLQYPEGMMVDAQTGFVYWTPTADQVGEHQIALAVFERDENISEDKQNVTVQEFTLKVLPTDDYSSLSGRPRSRYTTQPTLIAYRGARYTYKPQVTGIPGYDVRWELVQGPDGIDMDNDGIIFWDVPDDAFGSFISVQAVIDNGIDEVVLPQDYYLSVQDAPVAPDSSIENWAGIE